MPIYWAKHTKQSKTYQTGMVATIGWVQDIFCIARTFGSVHLDP